MPISSFSAPSALAKPGVVANAAARPASPYSGQVVYQTDTGQAFVWNGSAWVLLSTGTANPPGLELITGVGCSEGGTASNGVVTVGSAVAAVVVTSAFSSTYDVYDILLNNIDFSGQNDVRFNFDDGATNYNWSFMQMIYSSATVTGYRNQTQANSVIGVGGTNNDTNLLLRVYNPNKAVRTTYSVHQSTDSYNSVGGGNQDATTQHTKFKIATSGTSMTGGTITVYGYKK